MRRLLPSRLRSAFLRVRATFLPEEGFGLAPLKRVNVTIAWLAGQYTAHLCAASNIRAMPETEIGAESLSAEQNYTK